METKCVICEQPILNGDCYLAPPVHRECFEPVGDVSDTDTSCAPDRPESDRIVAETDVP